MNISICRIINIYKLKIFFSWTFIILTFIALFSILILLLYAYDFNIHINEKHINIIIGLTTGYLVSYITYVLVNHIPLYRKRIHDEKISCNVLTDYGDLLLNCFGGLIYNFKEQNWAELKQIQQIKILMESSDATYQIKRNILQHDWENISLIKDLTRLENSFHSLFLLNSSLKPKIEELKLNDWDKLLFIIKDEINNPITNLNILKQKDTIILIEKNFELVQKAKNILQHLNS